MKKQKTKRKTIRHFVGGLMQAIVEDVSAEFHMSPRKAELLIADELERLVGIMRNGEKRKPVFSMLLKR